jgi:NADH-quinone oxidoreductase subunit M
MNGVGFPVLSLVTWLPLVGGIVIMSVRGDTETVASNARWAALWTSLIVAALSLVLWFRFDPAEPGFQFVENVTWMPQLGMNYRMGVDGISVLFVLLSTLLTPICILASWDAIHNRVREYMLAFLVLETMMVGMFCALDFLVFYMFFEGVLIPMYLIIGIWGGPRRVYAAMKFFLFTLFGSVLMLLALLSMWAVAGTTDIQVLLHTSFPAGMQFWLFLAFLASFAVKVPMWPVHTWLPDAHVEAPTAGSVILAGVLLKMGAYGFLRFSVPMLPLATAEMAPLMFALGVIAVVYTSAVAFAQTDMKKLIAYSSVAHMGVVVIGIFTVNAQGISGALFQMLSHGVVSAALFLCVGVVYDRIHTRDIARYGGLADRMPLYAAAFMLFTMASIGLPGTAGFVGEFLVLVGAFKVNFWLALLGSLGMILGAAYALYLYRRIIFGVLIKADLKSILDLSAREIGVFAPLVVLTLWMGVYPSSFTGFWDASVGAMVEHHQAAIAPPTRLAENAVTQPLPRAGAIASVARTKYTVMAGLDPAIPGVPPVRSKPVEPPVFVLHGVGQIRRDPVDDRVKRGHDEPWSLARNQMRLPWIGGGWEPRVTADRPVEETEQ